ncbi:MAG TPA: Calx-beta domain-containing protein, partial [Bacillota bacterium]|nr:Calx-beta domain-containing protein [Bacillota bacterium]
MKLSQLLAAFLLVMGAGQAWGQSADLGIQFTTAPFYTGVGGSLTLQLSVTNRGPDSASAVAVSNPLPPTVTLVSATASQGTCTAALDSVRCDLGTLSPGVNATVTLVLRPTVSGSLTNLATVTAAEADPDLNNNFATNTVTVRPPYVYLTAPKPLLEGDSGTNDAIFTVRLSAASGESAALDYRVVATNRDTATPGVDFLPVSGTLTFAPGITNATLAVPIIGDRLNEGNETFEIQLTNLVHLSLGQDLGMLVATITDDDPLPVVSVGDVRVLESDTGTQAVFTVSLSAASGRTTSVRCATADGTA